MPTSDRASCTRSGAERDDGKGGAVGRHAASVGLAKGSRTRRRDQWEVSYTYPLSKRTLMYVGYVQIDNDTQRALQLQHQRVPINHVGDRRGCPTARTASRMVSSLGIVHFF